MRNCPGTLGAAVFRRHTSDKATSREKQACYPFPKAQGGEGALDEVAGKRRGAGELTLFAWLSPPAPKGKKKRPKKLASDPRKLEELRARSAAELGRRAASGHAGVSHMQGVEQRPGRLGRGRARLGPLTLNIPSHVSDTAALMSHSCKDTMTGSERGINSTEQERDNNHAKSHSQVATPGCSCCRGGSEAWTCQDRTVCCQRTGTQDRAGHHSL